MPDNPERPRLTWRERETRRPRAVVLDPDSVATDSKPAPTIYEPDVLLQIPGSHRRMGRQRSDVGGGCGDAGVDGHGRAAGA